jgi:hypothetical protein
VSTVNVLQPGTAGARRRIYNNTIAGTMDSSAFTSYNVTELLATYVEGPNYQGTYYANVFSGYFKAPATTNYKFYASCDDKCTVYLSNVTNDPTKKTAIIPSASYFGWRTYFTNPAS